jgi:hypothetical protein
MSDLLDILRDAGLTVTLGEDGEPWVSPMKKLTPKQLTWIRRNKKRLLEELEAEILLKVESKNAN